MKKTLKQLQNEELKIRQEINEIEETEIARVQIPHLKSLIGKCFAYRKNSYSCPAKPTDYWDMFRKILEYIESKERGFYFIVEEFSVDREGKVEWQIDSVAPYTNRAWWKAEVPFSGYEKITNEEYEKEKAKMITEMTSKTKMKKVLNSKWD